MTHTHNMSTLGIDVGSTTVKLVLVKNNKIEYQCCVRHQSRVRETTCELLKNIKELVGNEPFKFAISGSAGYGMANDANLPFIQEVLATGETVKALAPDTGVVIELGGEDAKVIFFTGVTDERMNGTCAGGTGAFIDQMATLLGYDAATFASLGLKSKNPVDLGSRCTVFMNSSVKQAQKDGASVEDISAGLSMSVVKNAIYKVLRVNSADELGKNIVVQGRIVINSGIKING